ncbi:GAF sensor-containing diguanylate cyclase [Candidatus Sulfotelmatomonas gaucii]|uniref:GAF sensor-containing diguanylate cyclase n=1 Tax=Candidatus Sulfuritelmatomonas gaucii TaxID=2043161 RepID=A0A2N9LQ14_9BACT|nr:GAF sensor-containing diguanylate cyclase [Candidatus Sulfotelmatomonas gaucii]
MKHAREFRLAIASKTLLRIIRLQTEIVKLGIDLARVTATVVDRLPSLTNAEGAILEYAEDNEMVTRGVSGFPESLLGLRVQRYGSFSGLCASQNRILRTDDSEMDPRVDREWCRTAGIRSMLVAPLNHNGTVVGVLKIASTRTQAFKPQDRHILKMMSGLIAATTHNAVRAQSDELYVRATSDSLTGLANRALFFDRLHQRISTGRRQPIPFGILTIDMDGLKSINDRYGHRAGDAAIRETALRIRRIPRKEDTVARIGGDEFGILMEHAHGRVDVDAVAKRLLEEIRSPFKFEEFVFRLSASVGTAYYPDDGRDMDSLMDVADCSMYEVKRGTGMGAAK